MKLRYYETFLLWLSQNAETFSKVSYCSSKDFIYLYSLKLPSKCVSYEKGVYAVEKDKVYFLLCFHHQNHHHHLTLGHCLTWCWWWCDAVDNRVCIMYVDFIWYLIITKKKIMKLVHYIKVQVKKNHHYMKQAARDVVILLGQTRSEWRRLQLFFTSPSMFEYFIGVSHEPCIENKILLYKSNRNSYVAESLSISFLFCDDGVCSDGMVTRGPLVTPLLY